MADTRAQTLSRFRVVAGTRIGQIAQAADQPDANMGKSDPAGWRIPAAFGLAVGQRVAGHLGTSTLGCLLQSRRPDATASAIQRLPIAV
jgi:hypothetical protein